MTTKRKRGDGMTTKRKRAVATGETITVWPAHELAQRDGFPVAEGPADLPAELARELIAKGSAVTEPPDTGLAPDDDGEG